MLDDSIEHRQHFVHAGDQCHFRGFASRAQLMIESFDDRVVPRRDHGAHVEDAADDRAAGPDPASTTQGFAVALLRQRDPEVVMGTRILGVEAEGRAVFGDRTI
jgi:hypothetical protein